MWNPNRNMCGLAGDCCCRYCQAQRTNTKTTAVLRKAFSHLGDSTADTLVVRYMHEVLFDHEFHYDCDPAVKAELRAWRKGLGEASPERSMAAAAPMLTHAVSSILKGVDPQEAPSNSSEECAQRGT
jgi:hypothetical protein